MFVKNKFVANAFVGLAPWGVTLDPQTLDGGRSNLTPHQSSWLTCRGRCRSAADAGRSPQQYSGRLQAFTSAASPAAS